MINILLPTDFSETSKNAIIYATKLYPNKPCNFFIVFINSNGLQYFQKPVHLLGTNLLVEKSSISVDEMLLELETDLKTLPTLHKNHQLSVFQIKNTFLKSIRNLINTHKIDLILMGTKGASTLKELFMGSSTGDVITKVECNVLAIPNKVSFKRFTTVVFATDLTLDYPDKIYENLKNFLDSKEIDIHLLHVSYPNKNLSNKQHLNKVAIIDRLSNLFNKTVNFSTVYHKNVEDAIRIFSQSVHANLIVMVSKNYGFFQKQFLDTTVEEVGFETKIPLLSLQS